MPTTTNTEPAALCTRYLNPASSEAGLIPVKSYQQVRGDRHGLKPDPQVEQIGGAAQTDDHADHEQQHGIELFLPGLFGEVGTRIQAPQSRPAQAPQLPESRLKPSIRRDINPSWYCRASPCPSWRTARKKGTKVTASARPQPNKGYAMRPAFGPGDQPGKPQARPAAVARINQRRWVELSS